MSPVTSTKLTIDILNWWLCKKSSKYFKYNEFVSCRTNSISSSYDEDELCLLNKCGYELVINVKLLLTLLVESCPEDCIRIITNAVNNCSTLKIISFEFIRNTYEISGIWHSDITLSYLIYLHTMVRSLNTDKLHKLVCKHKIEQISE